MKRTVGTVVSAVVVLALLVLGFVFGGFTLTETQSETLKILLIVCGCSVAFCFIVGELAQNFSQMDKLWSILPIAYAWIVAGKGGMKPRLVVYALIVTVWGVRLTINFARKGAYRLKFWTGEEDYRWSIVRSNPIFRHKLAWTLFDLFFISLYQNLLVLGICLPSLAAMESTAPFGGWDVAATVLAVLFLALETVADEYQWRFHQTKKKLLSEGNALPKPYDLGFNTTGPWSRMRHPNYLGEQGIWLSLYLFAIGAGAASRGVFHWSAAGPLLLILLFMGSSALGESISSKKYPRYKDYIEQVRKYIPIRKFDPDRH
jgi:steroid 5-alpha reductase family enzyme